MNSLPLPRHVPLAATYRGGHIENVYAGSYAVVDLAAKVVDQMGDVETPIFTRSSLKPFQALPLMAHPRVGEYALEPAEIALLCASHNGEARHAERAMRLLGRIGANDQALLCGVHTPYWYQFNNQPAPTQPSWNAYHHNCSGKHSGFVLLSQLLAQDCTTYLDLGAPVQTAVRQAVAYAAGFGDEVGRMPWGVDGCSAPNFALPLANLAAAFAWLSVDAPDARYGAARQHLYNAMAAHPEMVSGEGRHDLDLALAGNGAWVNKVGAEAVQTLGSRKHGLAIALKIGDGNPTALMVAFCAILRKLKLLDDHARAMLERWSNPPIKNVRGCEVGRWVALI
jgi:L-asparaginase II